VAAAKTERLMNLLIMLLVQRGFVTKDRIRELLYKDASEEAFERMFERDKEELRSLGVPIATGSLDSYFDDEPGYRILADEFALPAVQLTADEAAAVGLATRVWENASLAEATTEAVRKLRAAGADVDTSALDLVQPRLAADEPSFDVFFEATHRRRTVEFRYRRSVTDEPTSRRLQPWGVVRFSGRWYAVGLDPDRGAERVFRLSRVVGEARMTGPDDAYTVPEGVDVRAVTQRLEPTPVAEHAVVLVRPGAGHALRRTAETVDPGVPGPDGSPWDRLTLTRVPIDLAGEVLAHGADAYVESPAELRAEIVARLQETVR